MISDFAISHADLAVWIMTPDYKLIVLIDNHKEWAADIDTLHPDIVLQFHFTWSFELTKDAGTPYVHNAFICDSCATMPSWYLDESVRSVCLMILITFEIVRWAWIHTNWNKCILIWIVSDLAVIVSTKSPKFTAVSFVGIIEEYHSMVFSTGERVDSRVALESTLTVDLGRLSDTFSDGISQAKLALIRISTAKDLVVLSDENWVTAACLEVFQALIEKAFHTDLSWRIDVVFKDTLTKGSIEGLSPGVSSTIFT